MARHPKRPRDPNQLGKRIVDLATGQVTDTSPDVGKDPAAVSLGRRGGLKGGPARAERLDDRRRSEIAAKASRTRWNRESGEE